MEGKIRLLPDISHIKLPGRKQRTRLDESQGSNIDQRRQTSHQAHKTISQSRELAAARQRRQLSPRLHPFEPLQARTSPLVTSLRL